MTLALNGFVFKGEHSSSYFIVNSIRRSILPSLSAKLVSVPNKAGAYDFGTEIGMREFKIDVTLIESNADNLEVRLQDVSNWLYSDELEEITFDTTPAVKYRVRLDGNTDLTPLGTSGFATLTFIAPDPYGKGKELQVTLPSTQIEGAFSITNKTNAKLYPKYTITATAPSPYVSIASSDNFILVGSVPDVSQTAAPPSTVVLNDDMSDVTRWTAANAVEDGIIAGQFVVTSGQFLQKDGNYGSGSQYHGAAAVRSLPSPIQDFQVDTKIGMSATTEKALGRIELYLLDVNGAIIGRVGFADDTRTANGMRAYAVAGKNATGVKRFADSYGAYAGIWSNMGSALMRIGRKGKRWYAYFCRLELDGTQNTRYYEEFDDVNDTYASQLAQVQIHLGAYGTDPVSYMNIQNVEVIKHNDLASTEVPNIVEVGDTLVIDTEMATVYKNDEPFLFSLDPSSDFFHFKKGVNNLTISPAPNSLGTVDITYTERFL